MDRFKLEDAITRCGTTTDDLMMLAKRYADHPEPLSEDEMVNAIHGIAAVHELRYAELWEVFKQAYKLDNWAWMRNQVGEEE